MNKILKKSVWEKAKSITQYFEGGMATGNFDGQYLSMGVIQFNLGQNTLQPILHKVFSLYGADKWELQELDNAIMTNNIDFYLQLSGYGKSLVEPWKTRLNNLNRSVEFQTIADNYCDYYKNKAVEMCESFGLTTDRAYALFFDIAVQNGSIKWYEMAETEYFDRLKSIAEVTALNSNIQWRSDVRNRKMAIVYNCDQGRGWAGVDLTDESMYEDENVEKKEDDDYMDRKQIREELLIPDASWAVPQVEKAISNGILTQKHDANEIATMGVLATMMNNMLEEIKKTIQEIKDNK